MDRIKKLAAALAAFTLAVSAASCSAPAIGESTATALSVDGYTIDAGVFIYYTMQSYNDAKSLVAEEMTSSTPTLKDVEKATIAGIKPLIGFRIRQPSIVRILLRLKENLRKLAVSLLKKRSTL